MRILLAAPTFGVYGGIEVFVMTLADWLQKNTTHEVRVCFKVIDGCQVAPELENECIGLALQHRFVRRGSRALLRDIRWAELVHSNTCSPDIALMAKMCGRPLILTVHNWFRGRRGLRNHLWYLCNRVADARTYNSDFVRKTWEPKGLRKNSELIPTVSRLPSESAPIAERKGFFFIARLIENKGLELLLQAYRAARLDHAAWPLAIAGDGPLRGWARRYIDEHGLGTVELLGFIDEAEKARRMASSRWLVAPANTKEDMGLTPIEARSVAVPSIVTRDGGLPEAAGESALLCEAGDIADLTRTLETAANMAPAEYEHRAMAARESLKTYLRPMSAYLKLYQRAILRDGRPRADAA